MAFLRSVHVVFSLSKNCALCISIFNKWYTGFFPLEGLSVSQHCALALGLQAGLGGSLLSLC